MLLFVSYRIVNSSFLIRVELLRGGGKGDAAKVKESLRAGDCQA